ncbi:MAG TPA: acyl-CoA desaturase [Kofleriaceae bacterium]|jgi:stearoyl-CoA desaturase (delta-9 desaturase)|nr:acyl-CoA desaturase [Kofleriaceae bacterium]
MGSTAIAIAALYPVIVIVGLTNTIGYHRLLTHHSFETRGWLRATITIVCAQYSGSPMAWVGAHRVHHTISDTDGDPHTPAKGFWHAHAGWLCGGVRNPILCILFALSGFGLHVRFFVVDLRRLAGRVKPTWRTMTRDLVKERLMRVLDTPLVISACFAAQLALAWWIGGWWGIAWLWLVHVVLNNATWIVNSACHWPGLGDRPHQTRDRSRNVRWLALLTHGESHHNAHHRHPRSAHHGFDGGYDLSWTVIRGLARLGLAWDLQTPLVRS